MRHYKLKHTAEKVLPLILLAIFAVIIITAMKSKELTYLLPRLLIVVSIVIIIKLIIKIKNIIYIKKLKQNTKTTELNYIDTWLMCYGTKVAEDNFDYLLVFKDKNNKKYIARTQNLHGKYKCEMNKDSFKLYYDKKEVEFNQKFKVYIDEDYEYTIYDEKTKKLIIGMTPFKMEEKDLNRDLTKYKYVMMNIQTVLSEYDDAIYFKGIIEL